MSMDSRTPDPEATTQKPGFWRRLSARLLPGRPRPASEQETLRLPEMSRGAQMFSMIAFFVLGAAIMWFVVANPFDLGFLPSPRQEAMVAQAPTSPGAAKVYQCPMHPQVVQDAPGECPICGMDLVEVKEAPPARGSESSGTSEERKILYWYAPMDPTFTQDQPGTSPMGMKLVPKYADDETASEEGVIRIDPVQVQNIGVVSVPAEVGDIARQSRTVGILDFNADDVTWVNVKFEGWIEKVHVNYVGEEVREGQPLFEVYSPELVTTQEEYLRALDYKTSMEQSDRPETRRQAASLVQSTRERLAYWDITDEQIERLESAREVTRRLTVTSPANGVVAEVMSEALEGMYVKPGMDLYKIADLSTVWVHADVYEADIPWVRAGQPATVSFRNSPGEQFKGKVLFLYPEVNRETRTLKICVEVPNSKRNLRPGMYADVIVQGLPVKNAVVIPKSAVIRSGERNIVFVALVDGKFQPREVDLGVTGQQDRIQVVSGVAAGENVVTQAQFMLDSESRIQEAIAQYRGRSKTTVQANETPPPAGHDH
jgi:Cu(I)/Ag(I) efflux system membrane fusion protein/cobalt-zinc-cadmium efflux system membrane fusion protein